MLIKDIIAQKKPTISVEVFPPKPQSTIDIFQVVTQLAKFNLDWISVTYGAGGSTKDKTVEVASMIKEKFGIETLAHLTCVSSTKSEIELLAKNLEENHIQNVLALRGDFPDDPNFEFPNPLHFEHADDLVKFLKKNHKFCLGGAYYPEGHIEASCLEEDMQYTQQKVNEGMDFLISQVFFDNAYYYHSKMRLEELGVKVPLIAGIMPVLNFAQVERISHLSGCVFPRMLKNIMEKHRDDVEGLKQAGIDYAAKQIRDLIAHGVDGIHLYTMDRPDVTQQLLERSNLL